MRSELTRQVLRRFRYGVSLAAAALLAVWLSAGVALAVDAPNGPGDGSNWAPGAKEFVGTARNDTSRVYFTGAEGVVTEVFYPTVDCAQNVDLQLLVMNAAKTWGATESEERRQTNRDITLVDKRAMEWQAITTANNGKWKVTKRILTDPGRNSLIERITFETLEPGKGVKDYSVYLLNNPAINDSGADDVSRTVSAGGRTMLVASEPNSASSSCDAASALATSLPWKKVKLQTMVSHGFAGKNDGWTDLFGGNNDKTMNWHYERAAGGNVAQMGWLDFGANKQAQISFDVVLAFGKTENEATQTANATLASNLADVEGAYRTEWKDYCQGLNKQNGTADDQYYLAAMALKSSQDKTNGAIIAGMGTPWGDHRGDEDPAGYHMVWARDLFKFASALLAAGDKPSAEKALGYLFQTQMQASGRFPRNTYVSGKPGPWDSTQMDEVAMPIILAWKLNRADLWPTIKTAAEFLSHNGPRTDQERWEEVGGYSPSTIAAEVAGLICAASLADTANDPLAAKYYRQKADEWRNNLAEWTFTRTGPYGNQRYYIRINNQAASPDDASTIWLPNGADSRVKRDIVDGGFLELVRMGVMSPNDWTILETLPEYDQILRQTIPGKGEAWFRYNYDGYGENDKGDPFHDKCTDCRGRLWPIFTAERGVYEIDQTGKGTSGQPYLAALKNFSSPAGMISEQVWNVSANITGWDTQTPAGYDPGTATGSMRPLNWAMGEYINLLTAINQGHNDAPEPVRQRYSTHQPQTTITFNVEAQTQMGENIYLVGNNPLLSQWVPDSAIKMSPRDYPIWSVTVSLPATTAFEYKYIRRADGGSPNWEAGANRTYTTPSMAEGTIRDTFR